MCAIPLYVAMGCFILYMEVLRWHILYGGKVWQGKCLYNHPCFAKLKPSKSVLTIDNLLADLLVCQTFLPMPKKSKFAKLFPTKVSHYTVIHGQVIASTFYQSIWFPCNVWERVSRTLWPSAESVPELQLH